MGADMTNYTFLRQDNTNQTITDSLPPQENLSPRTPNKRQAYDYSMTPRKTKLLVEPKLHFDEPSLAQLNLDLYNYQNKGIKTAEMEMKTLPTRKSLARILEDHESRQSRVENSTQQKFSQNFVKFNSEILEENKGDIFQCGLCMFRTTDKIDLNDHWLTNCSLQTEERENDTKYQCSGCGAQALTTDDMKTHWQFDCSAYVKQEFKEVPETNLMKGTFIAKQELANYPRPEIAKYEKIEKYSSQKRRNLL